MCHKNTSKTDRAINPALRFKNEIKASVGSSAASIIVALLIHKYIQCVKYTILIDKMIDNSADNVMCLNEHWYPTDL